jgi:1,4-dihydroxy-6-naphthoate synthase
MSIDKIKEFSNLFTKSIKYGLDNVDAALDYAMQFSRGQPKETVRKFVKMYVNNLTLDMGHEGKKALERMFEMAKAEKMLESDNQIVII